MEPIELKSIFDGLKRKTKLRDQGAGVAWTESRRKRLANPKRFIYNANYEK